MTLLCVMCVNLSLRLSKSHQTGFGVSVIHHLDLRSQLGVVGARNVMRSRMSNNGSPSYDTGDRLDRVTDKTFQNNVVTVLVGKGMIDTDESPMVPFSFVNVVSRIIRLLRVYK